MPAAARFTTEDPVRDGANWFAYVNNDPVNWIDPWGLKGKVTNESGFVILVKPEDPIDKDNVFEPISPGGTYSGDIDGVLTPDGNIYKGYPGSQVTVTDDIPPFETTKGTDRMNDMYNFVKNVTKDTREQYGIYTDYGKGYPGLESWWSAAISEEGQPGNWGKSKIQNGGCGD
jgi:hypothetical protein